MISVWYDKYNNLLSHMQSQAFTSHSSPALSLSPGHSQHVPQWWINRVSLYGSATGACTLLCVCFFIFLLLLLFFTVLSVNLNHTSTQRNWQNCMYEVPVLLWIFGAEPHVIMCMWARNCIEPQSQLRVTCRDSIVEFLTRANTALENNRDYFCNVLTQSGFIWGVLSHIMSWKKKKQQTS